MACARISTVCCTLILVLFASHASAEKGKCWVNLCGPPLCVSFLCDITCWMAGIMFNAVVKEHRCVGPALNSECCCYVCDK
uniref:Uncharacterized protein n=1 Tax=Avena sativa TaxID=4498 RepID=A0ACD5U2B1_AVESA